MPSSTFFHLPVQKREKLLICARAEFARVPYSDVSINQIIRAAAIPRGSFYMYFTDKEELFYYLLAEYGQRLELLIERLIEESGGDLLVAFLAFFDYIQRDFRAPNKSHEYESLVQIMRLNGNLKPTALFSDRAPLYERLAQKVDRTRLELWGETDLDDIFRILIGVTGPAVLSGVLAEDPVPVRRRYVNMLHILARGMAQSPASLFFGDPQIESALGITH